MDVKTIQFVLAERNLLGKDGQRRRVHVAVPTGRKRYDFRSFCSRVARATSFTSQEVAAVLNLSTEVAREIVSEGNSVEFGDLGTLRPTFKSKAVPLGEKYRAQDHITCPKVKLTPSKKYFALEGVVFEYAKDKVEDLADQPSTSNQPPADGGATSSDTGGRF